MRTFKQFLEDELRVVLRKRRDRAKTDKAVEMTKRRKRRHARKSAQAINVEEFLDEELFKTAKLKTFLATTLGKDIEDFQFFKNPTSKELALPEMEACRGIVDMKGNSYFATNSGVRTAQKGLIIHRDILEFLAAVLPIKSETNFTKTPFKKLRAIPVQRFKKTKSVYISESVSRSLTDGGPSLDLAEKVFNKADKKTPPLTFIARSIRDFRE